MEKLFENWRDFAGPEKPLVVAYFGGFKPPHKGHFEVLQGYLAMPEVEKVYILFGSSTRSSDDGTVVVDDKVSVRVWNLFLSALPDSSKVELIHGFSGNPMTRAAELAWDERLADKRLTAGYSAKEPQYGSIFLRVVKSVEKTVGPPIAEPVAVSSMSFTKGVSSTNIRNAISQGDMETIRNSIPNGISVEKYVDIIGKT